MVKDFEIMEHTSDTGIIAYGHDLRQAFVNTARGMFSLITDLATVSEILKRDIELSAPDRESLLVAWLNELVYLFDSENILFKRFDITELNGNRLKARVYGEKVNMAKHELQTGIKAATYHMLRVFKDNGYKVQVLFDV